MRKIAFLIAVLGLAIAAQAATYGTVTATLGDYSTKAAVVNTSIANGYCGAYAMTFTNLTLDDPNATATWLWGNGTYNVFCIDPFQTVNAGVANSYVIHDLQDGPIGAGQTGMGAIKAGQIATLLNNAGLDSAGPGSLTKNQCVSLGLAIWEVVAENAANDGSTWNLSAGNLRVNSAPAGAVTGATADLNALTGLGTVYSTVDTSPYYALIRPGANGQDFVTAIAVKRRPVPEPLTMASAFMAISSLGLYIRRRVL